MDLIENADTFAMLVGNFGFPILVAVYLLVRFERKINLLASVIRENNHKVESINREIAKDE
ncbi:YvrJ family protein [Shouchella lehensis]|uniref:YvrJ family protein n=1 Tax=Shouchella lehensis TaxID=300825 RepID=A0A4Y7WFD0_9BACI|nr:YvrJ family protein [Shouchella lehensis]TES46458.1 YvrJ family protein [Shouchella lehensis]